MVAFYKFFSRFSIDVLGFSASALCAIHCAVLPVILISTSLKGGLMFHNHFAETIILFFSAFVGSLSILPSYYKHHRRKAPLILFAAGLLILVMSRFSTALAWETILTTSGALIIASAHFMNWKICRQFHVGTLSKG